MEKKSQLDISGPSTMYKSAGPFPYLTKASNQVENVLEARGLGLQLFFKGLLEKNRGQQGPPPTLFSIWFCLQTYGTWSTSPSLQAGEPSLSLF